MQIFGDENIRKGERHYKGERVIGERLSAKGAANRICLEKKKEKPDAIRQN